jgi:hypothetical protein
MAEQGEPGSALHLPHDRPGSCGDAPGGTRMTALPTRTTSWSAMTAAVMSPPAA